MAFVVDEPVVVNSGVHVEQRGTEQPIENRLSTVNPQQPNSCHPAHVCLLPYSLHPHHSRWIGQLRHRSTWDVKGKEAVVWDF